MSLSFKFKFKWFPSHDPQIYEELIKDDSISDLELCSKFAERYDNGNEVKPFEFEFKTK